jgi:integrase
MPQITEKTLPKLARPETGNRLYFYDGKDKVRGFAVRVTAGGAISFVLCYRMGSRQRRYTIGLSPEWSLAKARDKAEELRKGIRDGQDPLDVRTMQRDAPTMKDLAADYFEFYADKTKRASSLRNDHQMLDGVILPKIGTLAVADVTVRDLEALHASLRETPYRANRVLALVSKMFSLAVEWHRQNPVWRADNPATSVKHFPEEKRERWMEEAELGRLADALDAHPDQQAANAIRLLLLTGARKGEVLSATWWQFDLERRTWTKPSAHTKQKKTEHVPLSEAAAVLLTEMKGRTKRVREDSYVFPGKFPGTHLQDLKNDWKTLCTAAMLAKVRLHDCRHTYASHLVSSGVPLAVVGKLLGHTQNSTTQRYAHLADTPLREATNLFPALTGSKAAK